MKRRVLSLLRRWFAWADRADQLIRGAVVAYWLAPARCRDVGPAKELSPALLLRPPGVIHPYKLTISS